jgi:hypothetical protein
MLGIANNELLANGRAKQPMLQNTAAMKKLFADVD